jgi:hypothetical protein
MAKKTAPKKSAAAKKVGSKKVGSKKAPQRSAVKTASKAASKQASKPAKLAAKPLKRAAKPAKRTAAKPAQPAAKPAPQKRPHAAVVHWEIQATDPGRQRDFFASLFDWPIDANNPQDYGMVPHGGADSIGGGIGGTTDATARTTFYVEVPSIEATLAKALELGAATIMPRTDMGMVVMAQFKDLEGNLIGLVESDIE